MTRLITRRLGRTERQVTTLGLGGQASIQWTAEGVDPIAIIEKAYRLGINYMDTSNVYGPSQKNFGEAFRRLGLSPSAANYDPGPAGGSLWPRRPISARHAAPRALDSEPISAKGCWTTFMSPPPSMMSAAP